VLLGSGEKGELRGIKKKRHRGTAETVQRLWPRSQTQHSLQQSEV